MIQDETFLNLNGKYIGDNGASQIANTLQHNSTLTTLYLCGNNISEKGASQIANSLQHNSTLATLNLSGNNIGDNGASQISNSLQHNSTLKTLSLSGNNIGDNGAFQIANSLQHNSTLMSLYLSGNKISDELLKKITSLLKRNEIKQNVQVIPSPVVKPSPPPQQNPSTTLQPSPKPAQPKPSPTVQPSPNNQPAEKKAAVENAATEKAQDPTLPISQWDKHQVYQKLKQDSHFSSCAETFLKEDIDGGTLILLDDKHLKELGLSLGLRMKFPSFINKLSSVAQAPTSEKTSTSTPVTVRIAIRVMDVSNEPSEILNPIFGLLDVPLCSFDQTIQSLESLIPGIENFGFTCTMFANNMNNNLKQNLSDDEISTINLYTCESSPRENSLYFVLNKALREKDRMALKPFFPYLHLLLHAMCKLPKCPPGTVWRGVQKNISSDYIKGKKIIWWGLSSCTKDMNALDTFLGKDSDRTLFAVQINSAIEISQFSAFPKEEEVLVFPCVTFEVQNVYSPSPGLWIVQLKEMFSPMKLIKGFDLLGK